MILSMLSDQKLTTRSKGAPSTVLSEINARQALVASFCSTSAIRRYLVSLLRSLDDSPRLLQRLYLGRGSPFDLLGLKKTIVGTEAVRENLTAALDDLEHRDERQAVSALLERLTDHTELSRAIEEAIDEDALVERTRVMERKAAVTEAFGATAAQREEEENGGQDGQYTEGLWGKNEPWAVKSE